MTSDEFNALSVKLQSTGLFDTIHRSRRAHYIVLGDTDFVLGLHGHPVNEAKWYIHKSWERYDEALYGAWIPVPFSQVFDSVDSNTRKRLSFHLDLFM